MQQPLPRVDFYVLAAEGPRERLTFACRLAEKAWQLGNRVHALTDSAETAAELDELMWTFRQGSFVPHAVLPVDDQDLPPVTIGYGDEALPAADLLINLDRAPAARHLEFARVAEIVDPTPSGRAEGRERFRFYRQSGLEPETHKL